MGAVLLIAFSLALDAFAVSVCSGISVKGFRAKHAVTMGLYFGAYQFFMPLIGWYLGRSVSTYIEAYGHYIAFGLLALIGVRMIREALLPAPHRSAQMSAPLTPVRLSLLAVATSIDALAVGISMAFMEVNIWFSAAVIGIVAFSLSVIGGLAGCRLGTLFRTRAAVLGGLVLIGIGVKILLEHLL